ncbi:MAG: hypothetical protein PQJ46_13990 [Spirochaetales bacterium]|nr:hypothetical protein [Spirochaetales bacterium]
MDLNKHYNNLYIESIKKIADNNYEIDKMIDSANDNRFGLSLVLRPPSRIKENISAFLNDIKQIEPGQYYYPESDMHITVLSIISCYDGFSLSNIDVPAYTKIITEVLSKTKSLAISVNGITASPSCVMIRGFAENDSLNDIRKKLREAFSGKTLENTIDKRYKLQTAHSTVIRFRNPLLNAEGLVKKLEYYKNLDFGTFEVDSLELLFNDWYLRKNKTKKIESFKIG